jgi:hypothetical protein
MTAAVSAAAMQAKLEEDMAALVDNFEGLLRCAQARWARARCRAGARSCAPPKPSNRLAAAAAGARGAARCSPPPRRCAARQQRRAARHACAAVAPRLRADAPTHTHTPQRTRTRVQISEPVRNAQERLQLEIHAARLVRARAH